MSLLQWFISWSLAAAIIVGAVSFIVGQWLDAQAALKRLDHSETAQSYAEMRGIQWSKVCQDCGMNDELNTLRRCWWCAELRTVTRELAT